MTLRSMTGQGRAEAATPFGRVRVELRSVNNRGFKCSVRSADELSMLNPKIERLIREHVARGSLNVDVRCEKVSGEGEGPIHVETLATYIQQCQAAISTAGLSESSQATIDVATLATLAASQSAYAGVAVSTEEAWSVVSPVVQAAVRDLTEMRQLEGAHMSETLLEECAGIEKHLASIKSETPLAAEQYRERLESKVKRLLEEFDVSVNQVDLLRETQVYADRADVSEEITRLASHLKQFHAIVGSKASNDSSGAATQEPTGRKLDFVIQEMFREANTIGSKTPLASISSSVVEIKCAIERMRELVQNLE
ncbi:MAG: DUF1732 domain-containing protein [Planctomycetota bacterium]